MEEEGPCFLWRGMVTRLPTSLPPPPPPPLTCCLCLKVAAVEKVRTILGTRGTGALGGVEVEGQVEEEVEEEDEEEGGWDQERGTRGGGGGQWWWLRSILEEEELEVETGSTCSGRGGDTAEGSSTPSWTVQRQHEHL